MSFTIKSIRARGAVPINEGGRLISLREPVFERGETPAGASLPPIAFAPGDTSELVIVIELAQAETGDLRLNGTSQGIRLFSGSAETVGTKLTVRASLDDNLTGFVAIRKPITWELCRGDEVVGVEKVLMEIYVLPGRPPRTGAYLKGVPIENLRDFSNYLGEQPDVRESAATEFGVALTDPVADTVNWAFSRNPPRYDVWRGAPHFVSMPSLDNITLYWNRYLNANSDPSAICNCYDMASVVRYKLRTLGIGRVKWAFMNPFGYLSQTNLIGRGECNNPFYESNGTSKIIGETASQRTAFGNHAFCLIEDSTRIADACAGPSTGTSSPSEYVDTATDSVFPNPPWVPRGTVNDIAYHRGVTNAVTLAPTASMKEFHDPARLKDFEKAIAYEEPETEPVVPPISRQWPDPLDCPALENWRVSYEEVVPGYPDTVKHWRLSHGDEVLEINLYVTSEEGANGRDRFLALGASHQRPDSIFESGTGALGDVSAKYPDGSRIIWNHQSVTFDLESRNSAIDLEAVAKWLQGYAEGPEAAAPPAIELAHATSEVEDGKLHELRAEGAPDLLLEIAEVPEDLTLVSEEKNRWELLAEPESRKGKVQVIAVDPRTLISTISHVEVGEDSD